MKGVTMREGGNMREEDIDIDWMYTNLFCVDRVSMNCECMETDWEREELDSFENWDESIETKWTREWSEREDKRKRWMGRR